MGLLCVHPLCSSSLIPPEAFVAWLEFESEGFDHLVCSCLLHYLHRVVLSTKIRWIVVREACYSWVYCVPKSLLLLGVLCSQELVPLGCIVYPRQLEVPAKPSICEASGKCWEPPIKLWVCAPNVVKAPDSALKDSDSGIYPRLRVPRLFLYPSSLLMQYIL